MLLNQLVSLVPGQTNTRTFSLCAFIFGAVKLGSMLMGDVMLMGFSIGPSLLLGVVLILSTDKLYTFL